jgi:coatomer protein complex subunit alpha (xenin)
MDIALETCEILNTTACWEKLAILALREGHQLVTLLFNIQIAEKAYQQTKNFQGLSFLYLVTGNTEKQRKLQKIAQHRNDSMAEFQTSLYLLDVEQQIKVLHDQGQGIC